jgi:hypothetical protein
MFCELAADIANVPAFFLVAEIFFCAFGVTFKPAICEDASVTECASSFVEAHVVEVEAVVLFASFGRNFSPWYLTRGSCVISIFVFDFGFGDVLFLRLDICHVPFVWKGEIGALRGSSLLYYLPRDEYLLPIMAFGRDSLEPCFSSPLGR